VIHYAGQVAVPAAMRDFVDPDAFQPAEHVGAALGIGAAVLLSGAMLAIWLPLKDLGQVDRSSVYGWDAPELMINPNELGGQVQVRISYTIAEASEQEFLKAMHLLRRVRLRTGAVRWQLLKDADAPDGFVEEFTVGSWAEYQHQRQDRSVVSDLAPRTGRCGFIE
jgi:hypothetical protein